jgi:hypothetical protein
MKLALLAIVGVPILWLVALIFYLQSWLDWDKKHSRIPK